MGTVIGLRESYIANDCGAPAGYRFSDPSFDALVEPGRAADRRNGARPAPELKRRYGREVQVHGSSELIQTLLAKELVDELNLLLFPSVLGARARRVREW